MDSLRLIKTEAEYKDALRRLSALIGHEARKLEELEDLDGVVRLRSERERLERERESIEVVELPEPEVLGSKLPSAAKADRSAAPVRIVSEDLRTIELDDLQLGAVEGALARMIESCEAELKDDPKARACAKLRENLSAFG